MVGGGEPPAEEVAKKTYYIVIAGCVSFAAVVFVAIL